MVRTMEYKYTAIIIGKKDVGETDRIYSLYTREVGLLSVIAKGVRKPQAKLAAALETLTLSDVSVQRSRGRGAVSGAIIEQDFRFLKKDADALVEALEAVFFLQKMLGAEERDEELFRLIFTYLSSLDEAVRTKNVAALPVLNAAFELKVSGALGYALELENCAHCAGPLGGERITVGAGAGGALCADCAPSERNPLQLSVNAIKLGRLAQRNSLAALAKVRCERRDALMLRRVARSFLEWSR